MIAVVLLTTGGELGGTPLPTAVIAGIWTFVLASAGIAIWFAPIAWRTKKIRQQNPGSLVFLAQKSRDLEHGLNRISTQTAKLPTYLIILANEHGLAFISSGTGEQLGFVGSDAVVAVRLTQVQLPKVSQGIAIDCRLLDGSKAQLSFVPGRRGAAIFPALPTQVSDDMRLLGLAIGKPETV